MSQVCCFVSAREFDCANASYKSNCPLGAPTSHRLKLEAHDFICVPDSAVRKLHASGFKVNVKGGGRIDFNEDDKRIFIFGYRQEWKLRTIAQCFAVRAGTRFL